MNGNLRQWEDKMQIADNKPIDAEHIRIYLELLEHHRGFLIDGNKDSDLG